MPNLEPDALAEFRLRTEVSDLRRANQKLEAEKRKEKASKAGLYRAAREGAHDAYMALGSPERVPKPNARVSRKGTKPEVALLHLSDWQIGKRTETYSSEVAEVRVAELMEKVIRIAEIERADHPVDECHVLGGGDFCEGVQIFPGQWSQIDSSLFSQQALASRVLAEGLRKLASAFKVVHFWEEDGNHGRVGRRGDYPEDNADLLTYEVAKLQVPDLIKEKRVEWHPKQSWYSIITIGNYRALLVHGDEIRSFGGQTPAFGIARKVSAWAAGVVPEFRDCYMGHWHQPLVIPLPQGFRRIFVNPSIESDNLYAAEFIGAVGAPGQRLNFVEPQRGIVTAERVVWLN